MEFEKLDNHPVQRFAIHRTRLGNGWLVTLVGENDDNIGSTVHKKLTVDTAMTFVVDPGNTTEWEWIEVEHPHPRVQLHKVEFAAGTLFTLAGDSDHIMESWRARGLAIDTSMYFVENNS